MNRLGRPVAFTLEADVVHLFAHLTFGASGSVTLDQGPYPKAFSKGFCNASLATILSASSITSSSTAVTGLTNLAGVFNGMSVTGTNIQAGTTISSVDPVAGTATLSLAALNTGTPTLSFSGGQYVLQLGRQAGVNLDTYNHLLGLTHNWDEIANNAAMAGSTPAAPAAPSMFLVGNQTAVRTVPPTAATNLTDCTMTLQFGTGAGSSFTAVVPDSGSICRIIAAFTRSGAI